MYEAVDRAVRAFIRSGESQVSKLFKPVPGWFTGYVLSKTGHDSTEQVTRGDLIAAFEPAGGIDRSSFDFPQLNTRSNEGLYDRNVLSTEGSILRKTLSEHWDQIAHKFESKDASLKISELMQTLLDDPDGVPMEVWQVLERYQCDADVAETYATSVLRKTLAEYWSRIAHKFEPDDLKSHETSEVLHILTYHPDGVPNEIWEAIRRYHSVVDPPGGSFLTVDARLELIFSGVRGRPVASKVKEKRNRDDEEYEPRKVQRTEEHGVPTPVTERKKRMDEGTASTIKIRESVGDRKTYIAVEIPEDDAQGGAGEGSDSEMQATYMVGVYGEAFAPRHVVQDCTSLYCCGRSLFGDH
jgi:hypothetical protein